MNTNVLRSVLLFTASSMVVSAIDAQSLKQRELINSSKVQVADHVKATNQKCGTNIVVNVDWNSFNDSATSPNNPNEQSPWAFVVNVTDALDTVCNTDEGKAAVKAKIRSVSVMHAEKESESLSAGVLHYAVPYNGAGTQTIITYLRSNL